MNPSIWLSLDRKPSLPDSDNIAGIQNIFRWVAFHQQQIGRLAGGYSSSVRKAKRGGRCGRRCDKRLDWSESVTDEQFQFTVQRGSVRSAGSRRVGARE